MTLEELERGMELHEKRLTRIENNLDRLDQRLDRLVSVTELHEKRLGGIENNLVVQGELLNRLDQRLDRLVSVVEKNSEDLRLMQGAMTALFQRMDAFIRGLERNDGHQKPGDK